MKLITVLGATKVTTKQKYAHNGVCFEEYFSYLALAKALGISHDDIIVVGTKETKKMLEDKADNLLSQNFREVKTDIEIDEFFRLCLELIDGESVLDVTQGFRHLPMTLLLSAITAGTLKDKGVKDIYYAKTLNADCRPAESVCEYEFVSLLLYLDMASIGSAIGSFCASYATPSLSVTYPVFLSFYAAIDELSRHLLGNNLMHSIELAKGIKPKLEPLKSTPLAPLAVKLENEIGFLVSLGTMSEHKRFFAGAKKYFEKELLLHSVTTLFEAITAFLDYYAAKDGLALVHFDYKSGRQIICKDQNDVYQRRNCQKKALKSFVEKNRLHPVVNTAFLNELKELDKMRNLSAHAFIDKKTSDDFEQKLRDKIVFFEKLISRSELS